MNRSGQRAVEACITRLTVALATLLVSIALHGCTSLDHGAVELSWSFVGKAGEPINACNARSDDKTTGIRWVRLRWRPTSGDACATEDSAGCFADFECTRFHGVTEFVVPSADVQLSVALACGTDTHTLLPATSYIAPAPIVRKVAAGDVVELHAIVVEIDPRLRCE